MSAGIDYGLGRVNVDPKTGKRYGVISQHSVGEAWYEDAEPDYGDPSCPRCGGEVADGGGDGYRCEACAETWYDQVWADDPVGFFFKDERYELVSCLDSDIMVLKSPYFTRARFCSPCVPGAGNLDSPDAEGVECLCLGHEWFEGDKAPYPVYSVETGEEVKP